VNKKTNRLSKRGISRAHCWEHPVRSVQNWRKLFH